MNRNIYKPDEIKGLVFSNLFAFSVIGITRLLTLHPGVFIYAEFVIVPFVMGIICAWFWRNLDMRSARRTSLSILNCTLAILLSAVFLGEGIICLIIVSPLIFCFVITGTFVGRDV